MKCETCRFNRNTEYDKPCIIRREDCELYEEVEDLTPNEAIERLEQMIKWGDTYEVDEDACKLAIKALQKDIPIKVAKDKEPRFGMGYEYYDWVCPTCGWYLAPEPAIKNIPRRCGYCGQLLERVEE